METITVEDWLAVEVTITATGERITRAEAVSRARLTISELITYLDGAGGDIAAHGRAYRRVLEKLGIGPIDALLR